jgi:antitoxin VapB
MALNIKNPEVEALAEEVARLAGESKTEAIRVALRERRTRLRLQAAERQRPGHRARFLEVEVWSRIPTHQLGHPPERDERERILGYGEEGV